jgi:hypothetical protein
MTLPQINTATYTLTIPSTGKDCKYRPFLVREEKALLIAQSSSDEGVMVDTLKEILSSCTNGKIDVSALATFDLEYIFTQIRAKSVGEIVELMFPCSEDHGADNDKAKVKVSLDITTLTVETPVGHTKKIDLFEDVGIMMKYPTIAVMYKLQNMDDKDVETVFEVIADSVDFIYQGDQIFYAKETPRVELMTFLDNLNSEQFMKLREFFTTIPKISKTVKYRCPVCSLEQSRTLEGMQSFF